MRNLFMNRVGWDAGATVIWMVVGVVLVGWGYLLHVPLLTVVGLLTGFTLLQVLSLMVMDS